MNNRPDQFKLHLGCGKRHIKGYTHIDVEDYPHIDFRHNVDSLPFINDNTVDEIYACHVLEHFMRRESVRVLIEWNRVLKPGGILRVAVPDFEMLCNVYKEYGKLDLVIGPLVGRQDFLYNFHYNIYDFDTLKDDLEVAGFENVQRYDWRCTDHADVDDYSQSYVPHMDKENGALISLNVAATKSNYLLAA